MPTRTQRTSYSKIQPHSSQVFVPNILISPHGSVTGSTFQSEKSHMRYIIVLYIPLGSAYNAPHSCPAFPGNDCPSQLTPTGIALF